MSKRNKMTQETKEKIAKYINVENTRFLNKKWYYDFFDFLDKNGYVYNFDYISNIVFSNIEKAESNQPGFGFSYLTTYSNTNFAKDLIKFLQSKCTDKSTTQNLLDEMFEFVKNNMNENTDFANLLAKFCSLKFSHEIKYEFANSNDFKNGSDPELIGYAKLGQFKIAVIKSVIPDNLHAIAFYHLATLNFLQNQHIGQCLMKELFKFVCENFQGYDVIAANISQKNEGAQRFYARHGADFFNEDGQVISIKSIKQSNQKSFLAIFGHSAMLALINKDITPLTLEEFKDSKKQKVEEENC